MSTDAKHVIEVDTRGEVCPMPLMKAVAAMKQADPGAVIEVLIDYHESVETIPTQAERLGWNWHVEQTSQGPEWKMTLTKKAG